MAPKRTSPGSALTDTELEFMSVLWDRGEGTVRDVLGALGDNRQLAYTSVSTILRILEQKGILTSRKDGRQHIYTPVLSRAQYQEQALASMVDRVFDGTPVALVRQLLDRHQLKPDEIADLQSLLTKGEDTE